jgi:hypothetical protein
MYLLIRVKFGISLVVTSKVPFAFAHFSFLFQAYFSPRRS